MKLFKKKADLQNIHGDIRLHIESAENYTQVDQLCQYLETITSLKITSYNWSEKKGLVISIWLTKPTPLVDELLQMPLVIKVFNKNNHFTVVLSDTSVEENSLSLMPSEDRIFAK